MKKLIIILSVFGVLIVAMICEIFFVNDFYSGLQGDLEKVRISVEAHESDLDNENTIAICEQVAEKWEGGKKWLLLLQNHNTVRAFDDKIASLVAVVKGDNIDDARIFVNSAINSIDDILLDSMPFLSNIL